MKKIVLLIFVIQFLLLLSCIKESAELNIFVNCDFPLTYKDKLESIINERQYINLIGAIYDNTRVIERKFQKTFNVKSNIQYFTNINYGQKKQFGTNFLYTYFNGDSGLVIGDNSIYYTVDKGISFKLIHDNLYSGIISHIYFTKDGIGWSLNNLNDIFKTTNGGKDWIKKKTVKEFYFNSKIFAINENICWVGIGNEILTTWDGGDNWTKNSFMSGNSYYDFYFINSNIGWYSSTPNIFKTNNGGKNWGKIYTVKEEKYYDWNKIYFLNEKYGWIFYPDKICITSDGGTNWIDVDISLWDLPIVPSINDVFFINNKVGWLVGVNGLILTTKDGGRSWEKLFSGNENIDLNSINFLDEYYGWVVGDRGIILKTNNGGFSWQPINVELTNSPIKSSRIIIDVKLDIVGGEDISISQNWRVYSPNDKQIPKNQIWNIYYRFDNYALRDYDPLYDKEKEINKIIEPNVDKSISKVKRYIKKMN